ncbi:hypothetical protein I4U23_011483 [Adineta vaga]|nr:hypothetical protein I4U23_011483 [Adineta vaga]
MDNQLAETLWQCLNFNHKLAKLLQNTKPLGFNVLEEYVACHKDAQYAPSGDERSLFSLLIYLTDKYEKADAFYNNGNCYGSLYRVKRIDENKCQPTMDLNSSVDRTYITNRHQSQFIGQDLLPDLHFTLKDP